MLSARPINIAVLLLTLLVAACGGGEEQRAFPPLRYDYLPPIRLNVATLEIEPRFVPSGTGADVSGLAPVRPVDALTTMGRDRLSPLGGDGRAVLAIQEGSLTRRGDTISGSFAVSLTIYRDGGRQEGFVEARVSRTSAGGSGSLRGRLYDLVVATMNDMNVELEFQIRRNLRDLLNVPTAASMTVEQTPLAPPPSR